MVVCPPLAVSVCLPISQSLPLPLSLSRSPPHCPLSACRMYLGSSLVSRNQPLLLGFIDARRSRLFADVGDVGSSTDSDAGSFSTAALVEPGAFETLISVRLSWSVQAVEPFLSRFSSVEHSYLAAVSRLVVGTRSSSGSMPSPLMLFGHGAT